MHRFWNSVLEPLFRDLSPQHVIEVGSEFGQNTRNILTFLQTTGGRLDVVDPYPQFPTQEWMDEFKTPFQVHRSTSIEVLSSLKGADLILLDGDHNWYTVLEELRILDQFFEPFPVVLLHDVAWPYGRRDLYYSPDTVPERFRQDHATGGLVPECIKQCETRGFNRGVANARLEGTPNNGVLTAVEDFLGECEQSFRFQLLPGLHGLGILCPLSMSLSSRPVLKALLETPGEFLFRSGYIEVLEEERLHSVIDCQDLCLEIARINLEFKETSEQLKRSQDELHRWQTILGFGFVKRFFERITSTLSRWFGLASSAPFEDHYCA
jgi:hypothetical protein